MHAFCSGNNVVGYVRNNQKFAMTCAWAMMIDYGTLAMLLGEQSETGNNLSVGDIVGISALSEGQEEISLKLGSSHSSDANKFEGISFEFKDNAMLVSGAKNKFVCRVKSIQNLDPSCGDRFITFDILDKEMHIELKFLPLEKVLPENE